MRLFRDKSQVTAKCSRNKKVAHKAQPSVAHFWVFFFFLSVTGLYCTVPTETWNLFVLYHKKANCIYGDVIHGSVLQ